MGEKAILLLHEIYGINDFIKEEVNFYASKGFTLFCPNLIKREAFPYFEEDKAYNYFMEEVGLAPGKSLKREIEDFKKVFEKLILIGYSVGGTLAWQLALENEVDGFICIYGSRIRDYLKEAPSTEGLLIFSKNEAFAGEMDKAHIFDAGHGFMDRYNKNYDKKAFVKARKLIDEYLGRM